MDEKYPYISTGYEIFLSDEVRLDTVKSTDF